MTGHSCTFRAIERDDKGIATLWLGECQCGEDFTGPDYRPVEAAWDAHRKSKHHWTEEPGVDGLLCCSRCPEIWWPATEDPPGTVCTPAEVAA